MTHSLRMPAEWEPHEATWLAWPHYKDDWPGKFEPIPWVYAEIIRHLARHERVELIVNDQASERKVRKILERANALSDNIRFHRWRTDRVWTRDSGCTFVQDTQAEPAAITWRFNAWAKYPNWKHDQKIGSLMAQAANARQIAPSLRKQRIVLEGGSIDVNGQGTLLTTEECLLSSTQQRNRGFTRKDYEQVFADCLGIKNVVWLGSGIAGDDTHGHVDDITRFVSPDTIVTAVEADPADPNYEPLRENIHRLREATDQDGKTLSIVELPMPSPVYFEGRRLPASYANFYIANGLVLVPMFNDPNDRFALDTLADLFPDRDVVGIYSGDLIWGFGAMHCMTQQQPKVR
ncbi:MAG TPA: agmatine deiminase family protein [Terriglobales bacterium]|nr:agmatine deiminase family protein [Terriglobales bacterium]